MGFVKPGRKIGGSRSLLQVYGEMAEGFFFSKRGLR